MKVRVFRDPVHGIIDMSGTDGALHSLLETRAFQRLRRIHQVGFAWLVYAGAEHSRFGHALGAYHVACRVVDSLGLEPRVARHVKVAALVHDIGHGPFSHTWEQSFEGADHEAWGARIIRDDAELSAKLEDIEADLPATLCRFFNKTYSPSLARKLVSSQLDVDRLDYLLRDGHYSGVGYATYDLDWIIHALQIGAINSPEGSDLVIDYRRGMYAVEQYLFARSYMYAQVYHHKTVRAAEWMFLKLLDRFAELAREGAAPPQLPTVAKLAKGQEIETDEYLSLDDFVITSAIDTWAHGGQLGSPAADPVLRDLSRRLVDRNLFKTIDLGDDPAIIEKVRGPVAEVARRRFGERATSYFEIDAASQVGYQSDDDAEELRVVGHPRHGTVTLGQLMEDLPLGRPISTVRLVCAPELMPELVPLARGWLDKRGAS